MAGEAVVKRDLDCSKFSEITRYLLWHIVLNKSLLTVLLQFVGGPPGPLLNPGTVSQCHNVNVAIELLPQVYKTSVFIDA